MLYTELFADDLKQMFKDFGRDYFSYEACEALVEFFEDDKVEFDPIAICCDFHEAYPAEIFEEYDCLNHEICIDDQGEWDMEWVIIELEQHTWCRDLENGRVLLSSVLIQQKKGGGCSVLLFLFKPYK